MNTQKNYVNYHPLAPDNIEIKRKILSNYQLKIANFYNNLIVNVKTLMLNFFDKEKYKHHYENLQRYLRLYLKLKKNPTGIRIQSIIMVENHKLNSTHRIK